MSKKDTLSKKESFLIYKPFYEPIKNLSLEKLGELFKAIFEYQIYNKEPKENSKILQSFLFFKNQFRLDNEKYLKIVQRNRINGGAGGRPPNNPNNPVGLNNPNNPNNPVGLNNPNNPVGLNNPNNPVAPKKADKDKDKDKGKDFFSNEEKDSCKLQIPNLKDVRNYAREKKVFVDCEYFHNMNHITKWEYASPNGWKSLFDTYAKDKKHHRKKTEQEILEEIKTKIENKEIENNNIIKNSVFTNTKSTKYLAKQIFEKLGIECFVKIFEKIPTEETDKFIILNVDDSFLRKEIKEKIPTLLKFLKIAKIDKIIKIIPTDEMIKLEKKETVKAINDAIKKTGFKNMINKD